MIEVNVGQEHVVDVAGLEVVLSECIEQQGYAGIRAGIDKSGAATRHHQVTGIEGRSHIKGIDGNDAVAGISRSRHLLRHAISRLISGSDYSTTVVSSPSRPEK